MSPFFPALFTYFTDHNDSKEKNRIDDTNVLQHYIDNCILTPQSYETF